MHENHSLIDNYARFPNHRKNTEITSCENASNTCTGYLSTAELIYLLTTQSEQVNKLYEVASNKQVLVLMSALYV